MLLNPPPGITASATRGAATSSTSNAAWFLIALALLAPFAFYFGTAAAIVSIWNSSETFAHGYVILPISLWLIWRRRANFAAWPPTPWWPALLLLAGAGAAWLAGRMGEVGFVMQYSFVAMFPIIALALLGRRLAGSLAFPLLFMLFAVPFGEVFVDPLIEFTADFTVAAVQATGIPVLRNGTRFDLPTGSWSVVEACSGVRYLISSVTLGSLYAYLTYRSTKRRLAFVALSIVVPIVANGLRAYMIVMIGHTSGMTLATGVDHLIYGWLFFGVVMFIMFWIGSYWREEEAPAPAAAPAASGAAAASIGRIAPAALAAIVLAGIWPAFAWYNDHANHSEQAVHIAPVAVTWQSAPAFSDWSPHFSNPDVHLQKTYTNGSGQVALDLLYYRNQGFDKKLISSSNQLTAEKADWHRLGSSGRTETSGSRKLAVRETILHNRAGGHMLVWQWYRIDGHDTASNVVGKLRQAEARLMFRGDEGAAVLLSAPYGANQDEARAVLRRFVADNLQAIDTAIDAARDTR